MIDATDAAIGEGAMVNSVMADGASIDDASSGAVVTDHAIVGRG